MKKLERLRALTLCVLAGVVPVRAAYADVIVPGEDGVPCVASTAGRGAERAAMHLVATSEDPTHEEAAEAPPDIVRVPRLVGLRLTTAANRAEERGLEVVAIDDEGIEVDLVFSRFYRVRGQSVRTGATVHRGRVIEVHVRDR